MPCFSVLSVGPAASLAALSRREHTHHENGEVAEVVAAAEHLGRRGLLCATALRAPEPPVALAGSLLPEDTGHVVAFLRGDAGVGCIPGVQGRDQGLEIVGAKDDSTAPLSTFYQVLAGLCHQAAPDSSPPPPWTLRVTWASHIDSLSLSLFICKMGPFIPSHRIVEKLKAMRNLECPALAYTVGAL